MAGKVTEFPSVSGESPAVVFVNPTSGGGRAVAYLTRIRELLAARSFPAEYTVTGTSEELEVRAREAITRGRKLFLACGGDGTFQGLANAAFGFDVVIGVLPAGGGNDLAHALGLPGDMEAAAEAMLHGQPKWVDLLRARTADGRERLYAGGGGVGLDAEAMRYASGVYRRVPGRFRYIAAALRSLWGFTPLEVTAEFAGSDLPSLQAKALLAGVLNTPTYGGGLKLAPQAQFDDGWLDVVIVENLNAWEVLGVLPALVKSGELRTRRVKRCRARRVRLTTSRPCMFHGDGEILGPTPVDIEVVPRAVRILAPVASPIFAR
jgi:diacylglycerol kinase (ATP)